MSSKLYVVVWLATLGEEDKCFAERMDNRIPLHQLIKSIAEFTGIEVQALCELGRTTKVAAAKSIICYLAARRIRYSGEIVAKLLGITRSGVCRGASRGAALVAENRGKWETLLRNQQINYVP